MCGGKLFDRKPSRASFVEKPQATASIASGGRCRLPIGDEARRRVGELDDMHLYINLKEP